MRVQPVSWNNSNRYNNNVSVTSMPVFTAGIRTLNKTQHSELKVFFIIYMNIKGIEKPDTYNRKGFKQRLYCGTS